MVAAGALHVGVELRFGEAAALRLSGALVAVFLVYFVWRVRTTPGLLRAWGLRRDGFQRALAGHMSFAVLGGAALLILGALLRPLAFPSTFWLTLALYPAWGIAQQFGLQNLLARNVRAFVDHPLAVALIAAALFAAAHVPRWDLVALTGVAGVAFTLLYRRFPNLWAVGIAHGVLGTLAIYAVVGEDPGAAILGFFAD